MLNTFYFIFLLHFDLMPIGALGFLGCIFYVFIDAISLFYKSQRINYKPQNRMFSVILNCNILVLKVRAGNVKTHLLLIICEFLSNIHFTGMVGDSLTRDHNGMKFTTQDVYNDLSSANYAQYRNGARLFRICSDSHLNRMANIWEDLTASI